jgi:hypothetical protein
MTLESEVVTDLGEVIGRVRNTVFAYEPVGPPPPQGSTTADGEGDHGVG